MEEVILNGDWGTNIAIGKNFYKSLFKKETLKEMTRGDVQELFASYKKWRATIFEMIDECKRNETAEDRNAANQGIKTNEDILEHLHRIITEVPLVNGLKMEDIIAEATEMQT